MANNCDTTLTIHREEEIDADTRKDITKAIEDTVQYTGGSMSFEDDTLMEWSGDTRWNVPVDELQKIAKAHAVNIRAVGREDGVGFVQVVCINDSGEIIQNDEIAYKL